jgi:hypothetical protein
MNRIRLFILAPLMLVACQSISDKDTIAKLRHMQIEIKEERSKAGSRKRWELSALSGRNAGFRLDARGHSPPGRPENRKRIRHLTEGELRRLAGADNGIGNCPPPNARRLRWTLSVPQRNRRRLA